MKGNLLLLAVTLLLLALPAANASSIDFSLSFPKSGFSASSGSDYLCAESHSSSRPFFGLIFAGNVLNYVDIDEDESNYRLIMSQDADGNIFVIPATVGGCFVIPIKLLNFDAVMSSTGAFVPMHSLTKIIVEYAGVDIIGKLAASNRFSITMRKEELGNTAIIVNRK